MEAGYAVKSKNPRENANWVSKIFFFWMARLYYKGTQRTLKISDLYKVMKNDRSNRLGNRIEEHWRRTKPNLLHVVLKIFGYKYLLWGLVLFIHYVLIRPFQPLVLSYFIQQFLTTSQPDTATKLYISGGLLVVLNFLSSLIGHHEMFYFSLVGMRVKVALSSLIYRKLTRLSQNSLHQTTVGHVVNLLSNDVNRFDMVPFLLHLLWVLPFQVGLLAYLIWQEVGMVSLVGVLSMVVLTVPLQGFFGKLASSFRLKVAQRTDKRVSLMNEIISGIQMIKMYAWEEPFEKEVEKTRYSEISYVTKTSYLLGVLFSSIVFPERLTLYLTVVCYVLLGNLITADKVFAMAQFYNILQLAMAFFYPQALLFGAEALVSIKRIQEFLLLEEKQASKVEVVNEARVELIGVEASWSDTTSVLKEISMKVPNGRLCTIVGPVGCGKTSLLELLLGELPQSTGRTLLGGTVSYSPQTPWLFASSVRNNIIFGQPFDPVRYKKVVKACCLLEDFSQLPLEDRTLVGEKGVTLSGGQRARVNLARAVYREADVYLMDDPLSAVDASVGRYLFENCIDGYLKGKTRVLVTHQLQHLKQSDVVVVLNQEGRITATGTFDQVQEHLDLVECTTAVPTTEPIAEYSLELPTRKLSVISIDLNTESIELAQQNEENASSDPKVSSFLQYLKAVGNWYLVALSVVLFLLSQAVVSGGDFWVAYWTDQEQLRHSMNGTTSTSIFEQNIYIYIYSSLIAASIVLLIARSMLLFKLAMMASRNLHSEMFHSLLTAPLRFFNVNPSGRILNRFSKDMGSIDEILPRVLMNTVQVFCLIFGILVNVGVSNQYSIAAVLVCGAVFWKLRQWYVMTAKDIKYLEGVTKSPVFTHLNSTFNGLTTIRAWKLEDLLVEEFDYHQDVHTSTWYLMLSSMTSFAIWLDILCTAFTGFVIFSFTALFGHSSLSGSLVGLAISQSLILTGVLQSGAKESAEVINQMTSVERVLEYSNVEAEGQMETPKDELPGDSWPKQGRISFRKVSLSYSEDDPSVLSDLTFEVLPGEKLGIVGRTGAGKSSIASALFRLAPTDGTITIDGVDTKKLGLKDLRRKLSIIPQDPVLFSNTLRYNLDPFHEYEDEKLWETLAEVELKGCVPSLDYVVAGDGGNFSVGQRQLLCLARAVLRRNRILVMDEATANVDQKTDSLIQATVRRKFVDCTVITIAHRLNTIMDYDRVLVMDAGSLEEIGHPYELLQDPEGHFSRLVQETGPVVARQLKDIAFVSYKRKMEE